MSPVAKLDPNFPSGLSIKPSSRSAAAGWQQDTQQDIDDYGIAGRIWEAAYLLTRYLQSSPLLEFDPPCSVFSSSQRIVAVELGSGAGYSGLHLGQQLASRAKTGAKHQSDVLVLTDLPNVVPLMERNVQRAGLGPTEDAVDVRVRPLSWGNQEEAATLMGELDSGVTHLICSDLVYFPELLPLLLRSLIHLSQPKQVGDNGPELIISYKIRSLVKEQAFWSALGAWFDYAPVNSRPRIRQTDERFLDWQRFGSLPSDYDGPPDDDQEYFVFVGRRHADSIGCTAPRNDFDLMQGKRCRFTVNSDTPENLMESAASGNDYFEWLLLSTMGASLD